MNRVNGLILDRNKIQTAIFQLQYLVQLHPHNLMIMINQFSGSL